MPDHIIIDKLPNHTPWYQTWLPILVAVASIVISIFSLSDTRKTILVSTRPYIWATDAVDIKADKPLPQIMIILIKSYPAIVSYKIQLLLGSKIIYSHDEPVNVLFPDGYYDYHLTVKDFTEIVNHSNEKKAKLYRFMTIKYTALDKATSYNSLVKQVFIPEDNQWRTFTSEAN